MRPCPRSSISTRCSRPWIPAFSPCCGSGRGSRDGARWPSRPMTTSSSAPMCRRDRPWRVLWPSCGSPAGSPSAGGCGIDPGAIAGTSMPCTTSPWGSGAASIWTQATWPSCRTRPATTTHGCAKSRWPCSRALGSASMTARMCSQPHPCRKPISVSRPSRRSVERAVATSLGSGTGHCRLSDPGGGRWREDHRFTMPSRVSRTEFKIQTRWRQKFYMPTEFKIRTRLYVVVDI